MAWVEVDYNVLLFDNLVMSWAQSSDSNTRFQKILSFETKCRNFNLYFNPKLSSLEAFFISPFFDPILNDFDSLDSATRVMHFHQDIFSLANKILRLKNELKNMFLKHMLS